MNSRNILSLIVIASASASQAAMLTFHGSVSGKHQSVNINFMGNGHTYNAGAMDASLDGGAHFEAYCVDLFHSVGNGDTYAVNIKPMSMQGPNGTRAAWLFNTYAASVNTNQLGAALQLAIWDVISDNGDGFDVGDFKSSEGGSLRTLADSYLSASAGMTGNAYWLEAQSHGERDNRNQNLMTAVPEPSSIAAIAVGALTLLRRRKK